MVATKRKPIKNYQQDLVWFCIKSRLFIIILQYVSNILIPDHNSGTFLIQNDPTQNINQLDQIIYHTFSGFLCWDGQYFLHIIQNGYTYENSLAFLPIYPMLIKISSLPLQILFGNFINKTSIDIITIIIVNNLIFIKTALVLFSLTYIIFKNRNYAYMSAILFAVNPASIFFSSAYTESLFAFLTFSILLKCIEFYHEMSEKNHFEVKNLLTITLLIGLSIGVRSNGLLNIGFFTYFCLLIIYKNKQIKSFFILISIIFLSLIPFILIQIYNYQLFCKEFNSNLPQFLIDYGVKNHYKMTGTNNTSPWCSNIIPFSYSYVQNHYWNVGFLKYYEVKQIPNFLLATPMIFIMLRQFFEHVQKMLLLKINLMEFVFVVHAFSLTIFCILFVHIQVTTRMLCSASPILYWYCANKWLGSSNKPPNYSIFTLKNLNFVQKCIQLYFFSYFVIGTILFSNFLPWT